MDGASGGSPWWMAGSLLAGAVVMKVIDWWLSRKKDRTETDANVVLIAGLSSRIEALEAAQVRMGQTLQEEMKLRMAAQEEAHRLRLRVMTLEAALRGLGAVIPPDLTEQG